MMFAVRVSAQKLLARITAEVHAPEFLAVADAIGACACPAVPLSDLVSAPINNSIRDVAGQLDVPGAEVPMYRPADMSEGWLSFDSAPKLSKAFEAEHAKSRVTPGDIVLAIAGTVAEVARVPSDTPYGNINGSSARIKPKRGFDGYLLAYLRSRYGRLSLLRNAVGSVQRHLNLEDLPETPIAVPNEPTRRYIGQKIHQAERLRERSQKLTTTARTLIDLFVQGHIDEAEFARLLQRGIFGDEVSKRAKALTSYPRLSSLDAHRETKHTNRVAPGELTSLWTAQSYRPEITQALAQVRKLAWKPLGELCSRPIAQGRSPEYAKPEAGGYPCLKTRHVNGLFVDDSEPDLVTQDCAREMTAFKVERETILMNRSGAGSVGRCAVYLLDGAPLTNEHLLHIRVAEPHDACFITLVLSSWWGERAIEQGITGSTGQLNLSGGHVARVPIPMVAPEVQRGVGNLLRQAATATRAAHALTSAATQLVERLIEGTVTEAELIAAQQALDAGDTGPDRALLSALRAGDGASPLFPDLDALYALLSQDEPSLEEAA